MLIQRFTKRWWPGLLFPLLFFLLALCFFAYPGLEDDEVLFSNVIFGLPGSSAYDITIHHRKIPLMLLSYLGTLKAALYVPVFYLFAPSYVTVRLPVILLGALTVWLFYRLLESIHGRRAACAGTALLISNAVFLMTTSFDWGPVALQHLFLVAGLLALAGWSKRPTRWFLFGGFLCFGLAMWDKALFSWTLGGLAVAAVLVFPRELARAFRVRNILAATAGFCLGALPLIAYNLGAHTRFDTFRSNASVAFDQFGSKFQALRNTFDGGALLGYLTAEPWDGHGRAARTAVERVSFWIASVFGEHRNSHVDLAFGAACFMVPLLWRTRARKPLLFALAALAVAWFQMAISSKGGGSAHHVILLAPLVFLFLGVAFAEASLRWRRAGIWVLAAAMVYQVGQCLLVTNQNLYQLARYGAAGVWSDALYGLSAEIDQVHASQVVVIDWGMLNGIVTLHRGRLPVYTLSDDFIWQNFNADQRNYYRDYLDRGVWIGHTPKYRLFPAVNDRVVQSTEEAGYRKEPIKTVQDRNGREVFEMFRFVRRQ